MIPSARPQPQHQFIPWCSLMLATVLVPWLTQTSCADVVRLKSGGEIRGLIRTANDERIVIDSLTGSTITVARDRVHFLIRQSAFAEEYETRKRAAKRAADHIALAEWCRANKLMAEYRVQLQEILLRDPNHAETRKELGYSRDGVFWRTREQTMRKRGYVKRGRKYITVQERDTVAETDDDEAAEATWTRRMGVLADAVRQGDPKATTELLSIRDPLAISSLTSFFRDASEPAARRAYVQTLGRIRHAAIVAPLVEQAIYDADPQVREAARIALPVNFRRAVVKNLVVGLRAEKNDAVRNAALALEKFDAPEAIEPLINSLTTIHEYAARPSSADTIHERAAPLLNRHDLAPREVVAVLKTSLLPRRAVPSTHDDSNGRVQAIYPHRNPEVLATLRKLTSENFGYDQRTWRLWYKSIKQR